MGTDNVLYLMMPYIFHGSDHIYKQTFHAEFYLELSHYFYKTILQNYGSQKWENVLRPLCPYILHILQKT